MPERPIRTHHVLWSVTSFRSAPADAPLHRKRATVAVPDHASPNVIWSLGKPHERLRVQVDGPRRDGKSMSAKKTGPTGRRAVTFRRPTVCVNARSRPIFRPPCLPLGPFFVRLAKSRSDRKAPDVSQLVAQHRPTKPRNFPFSSSSAFTSQDQTTRTCHP